MKDVLKKIVELSMVYQIEMSSMFIEWNKCFVIVKNLAQIYQNGMLVK